jgi:putative hydrolase of the HAD superfamily
LTPKKTLFVDDKLENIGAAKKLELQTWHLQVGKEEVTDLFNRI